MICIISMSSSNTSWTKPPIGIASDIIDWFYVTYKQSTVWYSKDIALMHIMNKAFWDKFITLARDLISGSLSCIRPAVSTNTTSKFKSRANEERKNEEEDRVYRWILDDIICLHFVSNCLLRWVEMSTLHCNSIVQEQPSADFFEISVLFFQERKFYG